MDPDSAVSQVQRKIELQSPEDLTYLITNVRNAAAARLNEAFPHVEGQDGGEDELRNQIEALVNEYINKTFSLAVPNLTINGLPVAADPFLSNASVPAPNTAYEPLDSRKRQHVADLIAQEERLLEDVAALKRSVPAKVAADHAERVRSGIRRDEDDLRETVDRFSRQAVDVAVGDLARQDGVEAGFRDALRGLGRLKRDMPAVVAKMERARVAGDYVLTKGQR